MINSLFIQRNFKGEISVLKSITENILYYIEHCYMKNIIFDRDYI